MIFIQLFVFEAQSISAEPGVIYINFEKSYLFRLLPNQQPAIIYSVNPSAYDEGLFKNNESTETSFLSQSLSVKIKTVESLKPGDLLPGDSLVIESEFTVLETLKILGEFKSELPESENSNVNHFLQIGPSVETENFNMRADYRRAISGSLSDYESQGFFLNLDYKPLRQISLNLNADRQWTNRADDTINTTHSLFRAAINPFTFASFTTGIDFTDLESRRDSGLHRITYAYFAELNNNWRDYTTFIKYRFENTDDRGNAYGDSNVNELTVGIKKIWTQIEVLIRGGLTHRRPREENGQFAGLSFNYNRFDNFKLWVENSYERFKSGDNKSEGIKFSGGINLKLPFNVEFENSLRMDRKINGDTNYQFMSSIVLKLHS